MEGRYEGREEWRRLIEGEKSRGGIKRVGGRRGEEVGEKRNGRGRGEEKEE